MLGERIHCRIERLVPVGIAVVDIAHSSVPHLLEHPRSFRIFGLVVAADVELVHILLGIMGVVRAVGGESEEIIDIDGVITPRLIVGTCGRDRESAVAAVAYNRLSLAVLAALGGYENDSE